MSGYSIPWDSRDEFHPNITEPMTSNDISDPLLTLFIEVDLHFPELCESLESSPAVAVPPEAYHHITLKGIGKYNGDIEKVVDVLSDELSGTGSFDVELKGVDVFPNAVYIPAVDNGELQFLHEMVRDTGLFDTGSFEGDNYKPHITVGKFESDSGVDELLDELAEHRDVTWGTLHIDTVHLVKDGTECVGPFTTFESIEQFDLDAE